MLRKLSRHWPKPGRPAIAIAMMAALSAAVLPTLMSSAAASPAPAVSARELRVAVSSNPVASSPVLMINGDRLVIRPVAGGGVGRLIPVPDGGPLFTLHVKGVSYDIPVDALPYVGRGLDPNLFNLGDLQRLESAGRLPVRLTFTGARRAIPGITVTRSNGLIAAGYLTAASARAFGRALYRQFRSDHANAGYGGAALLRGVSIALAGAPATAPIRPQFPMHTLTVTGTNEFRKPDNGDIVIILNADNPEVFGDPIEAINVFFQGVAKYSVPAGHYWAITDFVGFLKNGLSQRLVVAPQFTVDRNTKLRLSARAATSEVTVRTPRPAGNLSVNWTIERTSPNGLTETSGTSSFFGPVFISPTAAKPTVGTIRSFTFAQLNSSTKFKGTPYAYSVDFRGPPGLIPEQHFVATPASLATVNERYYMGSPTLGDWFTNGGYIAQLEGIFILGGFAPEIAMPGLQTQYLTGSKSIIWDSGFFSNNAAGQVDTFHTLAPGQQVTENWNQYPLHPQPYVQPLTGSLGFFTSPFPSAFRNGNDLWLAPNPFSDNEFGHSGAYPYSASYTLRQNGRRREVAGGGFGGILRVKLSPNPAVISFTLRAQQFNPLFVLSPATTTTWVMHTAPAPHAVVPPNWFCLSGPNFNFTQHCKVQPMLTLNYQVGGLGLDAVVPPGHQRIDVRVGHIELAPQTAIVRASAQVSYDNGRFYEPVTLARIGAGNYRVSFKAPAGVDVTLKFSATDANGNSITETIINAYSVGL